ncbi:MAG: hypothetical protein ACREEK_00920 [Bradyrhizobium sp.]
MAMSHAKWLHVIILSALFAIFLVLASGCYFDRTYSSFAAEVALLAYVLHIDRSGGPKHEHISWYGEDRAFSIVAAFIFMSIAIFFAIRAVIVFRRYHKSPTAG